MTDERNAPPGFRKYGAPVPATRPGHSNPDPSEEATDRHPRPEPSSKVPTGG